MTATKEKPILFSGEMVRAILNGRKTQERRIVKPQPAKWIDRYEQSMSPRHWLPQGVFLSDPSGILGKGALEIRQNDTPVTCPYEVGMRLWVRETWGGGWDDGLGGYSAICETVRQYERPDRVFYKADGWDESRGRYPWRRSIHMPRWASRITLEITDIRVQRLQDTTRLDIAAEGWPCDERQRSGVDLALALGDDEIIDDASIEWYANLWDSINTKPGTRWDDSPWVWCLSFRRVEE